MKKLMRIALTARRPSAEPIALTGDPCQVLGFRNERGRRPSGFVLCVMSSGRRCLFPVLDMGGECDRLDVQKRRADRAAIKNEFINWFAKVVQSKNPTTAPELQTRKRRPLSGAWAQRKWVFSCWILSQMR